MEPETDLVVLAERGVIEITRRWAKAITYYRVSGNDLHVINSTEDELLAGVVLLEEREKQRNDPRIQNE